MMAEQALICECSRMSLGVILLLFFLKTSSIRFYPRSLSYLDSGSWPPKQSWIWVLSLGVGLKPN